MRQARSIAGPPATVPASPIALSRLSRSLPGGQLLGDAVVQGLCLHGGRVDPGDLFVAIRGQRVDGHDHAAEALRRGAAALVVDHVLPLSVPQLVVSSTRAAVGPLAAAFYGDPASKLSVVGVTGTNGKTTTCELVRACLDTTGAPGGQISSTGLHLGPTFRPPSELTTPEAPDLQASLAALVEAGSAGVSVEVSSHSLEFHRVDGIGFDVGVFLGLTPEHLDYHRTMEAYFAAKARLFSPQRCRRAIICTDDEWGRRLASSCPVPATTYGRGPGSDVVYRVESHGLKGVTVILEDRSGTTTIRSRLIGTVNAPNIVGAYLAARAVGVPGPRAQAAIAVCRAPPGRFEIVTTDEPFHVVVDYAHTPDALGAIIATARQLAAGRVHLVLGARGERYFQKRADMGRIAARADRVMFATDSPGDEEPRRILEELLAGVPAERRHMASIELDRKTAIRCAVESLEDGDILLLTGRGHEVTQRFADRRVPLDDRVVARFALGARRAAETTQLARPNRRDASVSVVIPVHNAEGTLERALSSVFAQTVPPEEVIVVDDGSTDGSVEVARGFGPTVSIVQQGHLGPSAARNAGMALSRTRWVALLDADDEWSRFKLERQLRAVGSDDSIVCCATDWTRSRGGSPPAPKAARVRRITTKDLLVLNPLPTSSVLVRRDVVCRVAGFEPSLDGAEDWDCWLRVSKLGGILKLDAPLVFHHDMAAGRSRDLRRDHAATLAMLGREAQHSGSVSRQVLAWHHLRFALAFHRLGDTEARATSLATLGRDRLLAPAVPATLRFVVPFLLHRNARHRATGP